MKYKKYLLYVVCILLIGSYIGYNIIKNKGTNKNPDTASTVPANSSQEQKPSENYQDSGINRNNSTPSIENKASKIDITMIVSTPNVAGNTSGNIANGGFAAQQGKWMYYTLPNMGNSRPMYRSMLDGETGFKELMSSYTLRFINVIGDWIYYYNASQGVNAIKKVKTDGTEDNKILDAYVTGMIVINDWIYYSSEGFSPGIFKIKTDGTEKKQLTKDMTMYPFSVEGNSLYYSYPPLGNDTNAGLYKIDLDGSNRVKLTSDNSASVIADSDWIYYINYSDNSTLYKIKKDGTQRKKLLNLPLSCFNISDNAIYYATYNDSNNIYKLNLQDNKLSKLTNNTSNLSSFSTSSERFRISSISIIDENIFGYCYSYNSNDINGLLYRVKKDGTLDKMIN